MLKSNQFEMFSKFNEINQLYFCRFWTL